VSELSDAVNSTARFEVEIVHHGGSSSCGRRLRERCWNVDAWPRGIDAITLFIDDLEATKHFYREVFGLPLKFEDDDSAVPAPCRPPPHH